MALEKNDKDFLTEIYRLELAGLYIDIGANNEALEIIENLIKKTDSKNITRDCIEQLCKIIIKANSSSDQIANVSYNIVMTQQKKHKSFSPMVDQLIKETKEVME